MSPPTSIPGSLRSQILLASRHACVICHKSDVQIHHIDGDGSNNVPENLVVLCTDHHDRATAPQGLTARLTAGEVGHYKSKWESECADRAQRVARGRSAFFMVDYNNAERLRQLLAQLTPEERVAATEVVREELIAELPLREEQGFDTSLEANLGSTALTSEFLKELESGAIHPSQLEGAEGHPADPLYPTHPGRKVVYDLWCQTVARVLVAARRTYDISDLQRLSPQDLDLKGAIISFEGVIRGDVPWPADWENTPVSSVEIVTTSGNVEWASILQIKTHYVYSTTAASSLSSGSANGLLVFRGFAGKSDGDDGPVTYSATPLIIGTGVLLIE